MSDFYAKICLNGHSIVESKPIHSKQFCEECGAEMISACPSCNAPIKEWHYSSDRVVMKPKPINPLYCKNCGSPYPWTKAAIEATILTIQEDAALSEIEQNNLKDSLPDLMSETPRTKLATIRVKKVLISAGEFTADAIRQFIIDFGCELARKSFGL